MDDSPAHASRGPVSVSLNSADYPSDRFPPLSHARVEPLALRFAAAGTEAYVAHLPNASGIFSLPVYADTPYKLLAYAELHGCPLWRRLLTSLDYVRAGTISGEGVAELRAENEVLRARVQAALQALQG